MKKLLPILFIIIALIMCGCVVTRSTTKINEVEVGMSKSDIINLQDVQVIGMA